MIYIALMLLVIWSRGDFPIFRVIIVKAVIHIKVQSRRIQKMRRIGLLPNNWSSFCERITDRTYKG